MHFQADILDTLVERPKIIESTALGAAYLAGIAAGIWKQEDIVEKKITDHSFSPSMEEAKRSVLYKGWKKAVKRSMNWLDE